MLGQVSTHSDYRTLADRARMGLEFQLQDRTNANAGVIPNADVVELGDLQRERRLVADDHRRHFYGRSRERIFRLWSSK